jgi:hypothetical protein
MTDGLESGKNGCPHIEQRWSFPYGTKRGGSCGALDMARFLRGSILLRPQLERQPAEFH